MNAINGINSMRDSWRTINPLRSVCKYAGLAAVPLALMTSLLLPQPVWAQSGSSGALADLPVSTRNIPGNLLFLLSNEYPANDNEANWGNYDDTINYAGYFDPNKCYVYQFNSSQTGQSYFQPVTHAGGPNRHFCDITNLAVAGSDTSKLTVSAGTLTSNGSSGLWSGNFMNWATMQTIDPVRSVLTGGYRVVDRASPSDPWPPAGQDGGDGRDAVAPGVSAKSIATPPSTSIFPTSTGTGPLTILEKAWNDGWKYWSDNYAPIRGTDKGNTNGRCPYWTGSWWCPYGIQYKFDSSLIPNLTPFSKWLNFYSFVPGLGNRMEFGPYDPTLYYPNDLRTGTVSDTNLTLTQTAITFLSLTNVSSIATVTDTRVAVSPQRPCSNSYNPYACYQVYVRVSVCDNSKGLDGQSLLESNCVYYPSPSGHYKPEGLFQKYAGQMRYGLFSYPYNSGSNTVVLRSAMGAISQNLPNTSPVDTAVTANSIKEWNAATGVIYINPNPPFGSTINSSSTAQGSTGSGNLPLSLFNQFGGDHYVTCGGDRPTASTSVTSSSCPAYPGGGYYGAVPYVSENLYYPMGTQGQSGFLNFVNKYGEYYGYWHNAGYKVWDIVDDLYYGGLRYYQFTGNPWTVSGTAVTTPLPAGRQSGDHAATDGFPFVTTWSDPVQYRCQKNFILGLSDAHTWNGWTTGRSNDIPTIDSAQAGGNNQVGTWVNRMGTLEGIASSWPSTAGNKSSLAWPQWDGNWNQWGTTSTYYTAGMAYMAHVTDIRPDLPSVGKINNMMNVDTYWVDMTESNVVEHLNPYLLASKYGSFAVPSNYKPDSPPWSSLPQSLWNTTGNTLATHLRGSAQTTADKAYATLPSNGKYPQPDNYFTANNSAMMAASLDKALANMASGIKSYSTAAALSSGSVAAGGSGSYAAQYSNNWTGTVYANSLTISPGVGTTAATASQQQVWNTDGTLPTQLAMTSTTVDPTTGAVVTTPVNGWDTNRRVLTWNPSLTKGVPFRWANLSGTQQSALYAENGITYGVTRADGSINNVSVTLPGGGADYANYLRGDRTNEMNANIIGGTNALRARDKLLGDIINSKVTPAGPPNMPYADSLNPGYSDFKTRYASRTPMVYVGANDGMLHAFNGKLTNNPPDTQSGTELFAYVPSAMFQGPTAAQNAVILKQGGNPTTSPDNLLTWLGNPHYVHHNSVDATALLSDVDFDRTGANPTGTGSPDWHTMLVGGLGKGGSSFYALDVTNPDALINAMNDGAKAISSGSQTPAQVEATVESSAAGNVLWEFTQPDMGYSYGAPIVIKTGKYGWVVALTSGYDKGDGKTGGVGHLYLVNPKTGALLQEIDTAGPSNGLTQASAYVADYANYTADSIYAGDLNGNLWRFDLTTLGSSSKGQLLARLTDPSGNGQPVTTAPLIEIDPSTSQRFVLTGTGKLLDFPDATSAQVQTFYAIKDGETYGFNSIPAAPITRNDLVQQKDLTQSVSLSNSQGWYFDLGDTTQYPNNNYVKDGTTTYPAAASATGERVLVQPVANSGLVALSTDLMTLADSCLPVVSNLYVIGYGTGRSALVNNVTYLPQTSRIVDLLFANASDGSLQLLAGNSLGGVTDIGLQSSGSVTKVLNWRSVPVTGN